MDPKIPEPGEIIVIDEGETDEEGNPVRSVNIGAPAAHIGVEPGDNG